MLDCKIIEIKTPNKYLLNALFLGKEKPKNIFIFIHGLAGNLFSKLDFVKTLIDENSSVIVFNNRGAGVIDKIYKEDKRKKGGYSKFNSGMAYEIFSDCVDDIDGVVNYASKTGAKKIILIGHSTGCQKSVYYLAKKKKNNVSSAILLAPMSDFATMFKNTEKSKYLKLIKTAEKMVLRGDSLKLMPLDRAISAQRFLSLFSPKSEEEIFSYASNREPKLLKAIKKPLLIVLAGNDKFRDRPIIKISSWFEKELKSRDTATIKTVKQADHSFSGKFLELNRIIKQWLRLNCG